MKLIYGNALHENCDALCITTNGYVSTRGNAVMGRGIAKQIADLFRHIPIRLGSLIKSKGNNVHLLDTIKTAEGPIDLLSFPVKPHSVFNHKDNVVSHAVHMYEPRALVPGYHAKADLKLIARSCRQLVDWANKTNHKKIVLVRPGCGAGELDWETQVKPILESMLDDRFHVITYKE